MALDEAIASLVKKDGIRPALRLYGWDGPSLSLGCFQDAADLDIAYCRARHIPIVRRPTGGRAILHGDELTYSLSARTDCKPFSGGLLDSYRRISSAFSLAFRKIGVVAEAKGERERGRVLAGSPLCFQSSSYGEILVNRKKVVGSAQKRWNDCLLQQGSIPYSYDEEAVRGIFGAEKFTALRDCTVGLKEVVPDLDEEEFRQIVAACFEEAFGVSLSPALPSPEELALAGELEREKYLQDHWNLQRQSRPSRQGEAGSFLSPSRNNS